MGNTVTICFANNKGGSGKSTSCSNVGAALAGMGKKVLMVDGDMQLNLSLSFFSEEEVLEMEYDWAANVLPLPCDQRYGEEEMRYIADSIREWEETKA